MDEQETAEAIKAIGMMLRAFPSSASSITAETPRVYAFAVEEFSLEAVRRACRAFVRGQVEGHNPDFAPSTAKLAQVVKGFNDALAWEQFQQANTFVPVGSDLWRQVALMDGREPPVSSSSGKEGWWLPNAKVAEARLVALPPPVSEAQMQVNAVRVGALVGAKTFNAADDDNHDMGGERVA
ncbi:hypothetical protein VW35_00905 [Devosia soli]|uniref:Uncharacterized protein n=1 Tax=Devosia soli TaxID=361041 RepID=A0A0F5LET1_9HYPH|nr:hypothetical protein [Devosia soli]KKB80800.1 hypothetical protein VW35_00905 [Devosia soli]